MGCDAFAEGFAMKLVEDARKAWKWFFMRGEIHARQMQPRCIFQTLVLAMRKFQGVAEYR
jgi:hypothetical protein